MCRSNRTRAAHGPEATLIDGVATEHLTVEPIAKQPELKARFRTTDFSPTRPGSGTDRVFGFDIAVLLVVNR